MNPITALQAYRRYCADVYRLELLARPEQWLLRNGHFLLESDYQKFVQVASMMRVNRIITLRTFVNDLEWSVNRDKVWESEYQTSQKRPSVFKRLRSLLGV